MTKMKNIFRLLTVVVVLGMASEGCSKNDFNINANPNTPTVTNTPFRFLLPVAQVSTATRVATSWRWLNSYLGYWARSGTFAPAADEESYNLTTAFQGGIFNGFYDTQNDFELLQTGAMAANSKFYEGIARIMKSHNFAILVDLYNNIPYSQALKGAGNTTPSYDKGADVYRSLLNQIDSGMVLIKAATSELNPTIAVDDVMFGNKLFPATTFSAQQLRWAQFGNTLKLRLLVHLMGGGITSNAGTTPQTTVPGFNIPAEIAKLTADVTNGGPTGFLTFDAQVNPGYNSQEPNPFFNSFVQDITAVATQNSVYTKANSYAVGPDYGGGYYPYNGDPRLNTFYTLPTVPAGTTTHRGVAYGLPSANANAAANLSSIGPAVTRGADKPVYIVTAAESYMLQAEAAQRGFAIGGTASALLTAGIRASFTSAGLTTAQADAYITGNATFVDVDIAGTQLFQGILPGIYTIISQKWFALNGITPYEVWTDYRRVDFSPTTKHFVYGVGSGFAAGPAISVYQFNTRTEIPKRLLYPQSEYNFNAANAGAEGTIDAFVNRIFWDLN